MTSPSLHEDDPPQCSMTYNLDSKWVKYKIVKTRILWNFILSFILILSIPQISKFLVPQNPYLSSLNDESGLWSTHLRPSLKLAIPFHPWSLHIIILYTYALSRIFNFYVKCTCRVCMHYESFTLYSAWSWRIHTVCVLHDSVYACVVTHRELRSARRPLP